MRVDLCESTLMCFRNTVYLGLNYEGVSQSLADYRDKIDHDPSGATIRWTIDLLFYVVVIVMLLNIIFGIVIDTFAQQRDLQKQIKDDIDNVCFVCGIDRNTFDRKHPIGFEHHIRFEHNLWHYCTPCVSNTRARTRAPTHTQTRLFCSQRHVSERDLCAPCVAVSFMVHLRVKGETEYTGPESYVKDMLVKGDFSFMSLT